MINNNSFPNFQDIISTTPAFPSSPTHRTQTGESFAQEILTFSRQIGFMGGNRYCVLFRNTPRASGMLRIDSKRLSLNCSSVTFPDATFSVLDRDIAGPKQTIPYVQQYGDSSAPFEFSCGTDLYEYLVFRSWQKTIIDPVSRYVGYYDNYAKNCSLTVMLLPNYVRNYNEALERIEANEIYGITYSEIYPKTVTLKQAQSAATGVLGVTVNFGYREVVPFRDFSEDFRFAASNFHPALPAIEAAVPNGIKKNYTEAEIMKFKSMFMSQKPLGTNQADIKYPVFAQPQTLPKPYLPPQVVDIEANKKVVLPPQPKNISANVFLNNLLTSGINTAALFKGI